MLLIRVLLSYHSEPALELVHAQMYRTFVAFNEDPLRAAHGFELELVHWRYRAYLA